MGIDRVEIRIGRNDVNVIGFKRLVSVTCSTGNGMRLQQLRQMTLCPGKDAPRQQKRGRCQQEPGSETVLSAPRPPADAPIPMTVGPRSGSGSGESMKGPLSRSVAGDNATASPCNSMIRPDA